MARQTTAATMTITTTMVALAAVAILQMAAAMTPTQAVERAKAALAAEAREEGAGKS
jgi:hypothetical protein